MIQPTTPTKGATDPDVAELQNRLGVPSASDRCNPDASYRYALSANRSLQPALRRLLPGSLTWTILNMLLRISTTL